VRDHAHRMAERHDLDVSVIYLIYDEGVREGWATRKGQRIAPTVTPLRPRTR